MKNEDVVELERKFAKQLDKIRKAQQKLEELSELVFSALDQLTDTPVKSEKPDWQIGSVAVRKNCSYPNGVFEKGYTFTVGALRDHVPYNQLEVPKDERTLELHLQDANNKGMWHLASECMLLTTGEES